MQPSYMPFIDPNPLPAPLWVFVILLYLTFILHILSMNFMLGGAFLAFISRYQSKKDDSLKMIYPAVTKKIPTFLAATVTLGVAPLLFVQVLYGRYFYTSSVILGWPWFSIIILITLAYYGFYLVAFKTNSQKSYSGILLLAIILIFIVGFIFSNNFTLLQTPQTWGQKYFADPSGWNLNLEDPTLWARFLHFFIASIAIGGLFITLIGFFRWKNDPTTAKLFIDFGGKWFIYSTAVQILVGIWFLFTLSKSAQGLLMGKNVLATFNLILGILGAPIAIWIMHKARHAQNPLPQLKIVYGLTFLIVVFMSITRGLIRNQYLHQFYQPANFTIQPQWDVLAIFFIAFLMGIILWGMMIKKYFFTPEVLNS